jgi:hypothetical protein
MTAGLSVWSRKGPTLKSIRYCNHLDTERLKVGYFLDSPCYLASYSPFFSLYCNEHYMLRPNWPSWSVQVVRLRKLLFRSSAAVAAVVCMLVTSHSHARDRFMICLLIFLCFGVWQSDMFAFVRLLTRIHEGIWDGLERNCQLWSTHQWTASVV